jgi:uncharacterized protein YndB with AHSA1/START domain
MALEHQVVRRERVLPVDRDTAWAALRHAGALATWLADEVELEIREGAEGTLRWRDGEERSAVVEEVLARRRIVLRWWEPGGEPSLVELTLDDVAGGTRLVIVELPVLVLEAVGIALDGALGSGGGSCGPRMAAPRMAIAGVA